MTETNMLYKLSSLYILSRVDCPLSTNSLCLFLLERKYTDYFTFQQGIAELLDDGYINKEAVHDKYLYTITDEGRKAISLLKNELSSDIRLEMDDYIKANKFHMHDDISVLSNYYCEDINKYIVHLFIEENGDRLLELNLSVSSVNEAERMCENWKKGYEDIYPFLISTLSGHKKV